MPTQIVTLAVEDRWFGSGGQEVRVWKVGSQSDWAQGDPRAVACQEIGHGLGMAHQNQGDCMAFGYYSQYMDRISSHTRDDIDAYYRIHLG